MKGGFTYIMTNKSNSVLHVGVTSNLKQRIIEHKEKIDNSSFTARYNINKLIYFEEFSQISAAIEREKKLKNYSRANKIKLIEKMNPEWSDLFELI